MRYLVKARLKREQKRALLQAIQEGTLGSGSIAGDEYMRNMVQARSCQDGTTRWVEVCFCSTPLQEERPYWEEYFELVEIKNAHDRRRCRDLNGTESWACCDCDCTKRLEDKMQNWGEPFLERLKEN
jgi:hypothetical protein